MVQVDIPAAVAAGQIFGPGGFAPGDLYRLTGWWFLKTSRRLSQFREA